MEILGDHKPKYCISKELESLVGAVASVFSTPGTVSEGLGQQRKFSELVIESLHQFG